FPSIITYWYRYSHDGVRIDTETDDDSIGAHFLHLLRGEKPNALHEQVMNVALILYAEHEVNASTFTARVVASTLSDLHRCSIGAHFLHLLRGEKPNALHEQVMNVSLILYAEHEFNASTFTARVCASTLSDLHSCITGAIGSLRGPLHGGANEAAMDMIENWQ